MCHIVLFAGLLVPATSKALILECSGTTTDGEKISVYMEWEGGTTAKFLGTEYEIVETGTFFDLYLEPHRTSKGISLDKTKEYVSINRIDGRFAVNRPPLGKAWFYSKPEDQGCIQVKRRF